MQLKVFIGGVWAKFTCIEGSRGQIKFQNWMKFKTTPKRVGKKIRVPVTLYTPGSDPLLYRVGLYFLYLRGLLYLIYSENPISRVKIREGLKITRPSSNSEAVTMYKLKGQSSNIQTGQSFKNKELVCLARPIPLLSLAN